MSLDLDKIKRSRLFKGLPDRAFAKIAKLIKIRAFANGESVLHFPTQNEFAHYFGYVVTGRVLFVSAQDKPLGIAIKDEFFLGRAFSLNDETTSSVVSASDATLVVFIPKIVISSLSEASGKFSEIMEDIYESVFERAKLIANDASAPKHFKEWIQSTDINKTISGWIAAIEKKRSDAQKKREKDKKLAETVRIIWGVGLLLFIVALIEVWARTHPGSFSFSSFIFPTSALSEFNPGSDFNIGIGVIGYTFIMFTLLHTGAKWAIRKLKWKINYQLSAQLHIFFGVLGSLFILLHTAFQLKGINVAHLASYSIGLGLLSGFIGQFISNQIPKTIRGEKVKLESLQQEQKKLQQRAELLLENQNMHQTSLAFIAKGLPRSFWGNIFATPHIWWRAYRLRSALKGLGIEGRSAAVAADLILDQYQLNQRIQFLEVSNVFFKRWMLVHKPMGYAAYFLSLIHVLLVTLLA